MEEELHQQQQHRRGGGGSNIMDDLRHFFSPRSSTPYPPPPSHHSLFSGAATGAFTPLTHHRYDMMLVMGGPGQVADPVLQSGVGIHSDSTITTTSTTTVTAAATAAAVGGGGFDVEAGGGSGFGLGVGGVGGGGGTARWPRQETLTLLEVRSRLDHKFKEANQKGPLWDEVSSIMFEEHGYQRSGKKCREKFENLYKYYKKTKEGKAGRQDGKHYRFFRQLESLYGEASHSDRISNSSHSHLNMAGNNNTSIQFHSTINTTTGRCNYHHHQEGFHRSTSLSNSLSELHTSSSDDNDLNGLGMDMMLVRNRKRRGKRSWKSKIKDFIDSQMRKVMEKQEAWLEKMMRTLEHKEKERILREEEWRNHEAKRLDREQRLRAEERAWIEARVKALMDALQKLTGKKVVGEEKDLSSDHTEELFMAAHERKQKLQHEEGEKSEDRNDDSSAGDKDRWVEPEITKLIQLRASMNTRFEQCSGGAEEGNLWEEIATLMASLGYDRSATMCKEKWDFINNVLLKRAHDYKDNHKKRKENWRVASIDCSSSSHHQHLQSCENNHHYSYGETNGQGGIALVPPEIGLGEGGDPMADSFRFLLGDGAESHMRGSYGTKLNKGPQNHR